MPQEERFNGSRFSIAPLARIGAMMSPGEFQRRLFDWFDVYGRKDLPWQQQINAYRVWVSEIMLQQTQVVSVIGYFQRFMTRFPSVRHLADADLDEVLQYWSGLGYYARARNLHKTAQLVVAEGGEFPQSLTALSALPGIGRSTAGAILSIAFGQSQAILDGNVKRVLTRFHGVYGWPGDSKVAARLWQLASDYTPTQRCGDYTQAMMDLGATLCTRSKPRCEACPVADHCQAKRWDWVRTLPESRPRKVLPVKRAFFLILQDAEQRVLLEKRPPVGIWGGLWSVPEFADFQSLQAWCAQNAFHIEDPQPMAAQRHSFSHYHLDFTPLTARLQNPINNVMEGGQRVWYKACDIDSLGLPAPVRRLLRQQHTEVEYDENG